MNIITNTDKKIVHFIIRIWLIIGFVFVGYGLFRAYSEGYVYTRSGRQYMGEDPIMFWFIVTMQLVLIGIFVFYFFKKPDIDKMGKD
jgi:hypothetical protein